MTSKTMRKALAVVLSAALAVSGLVSGSTTSQAAAKAPKLSKTKATLAAGKSVTVTVKNTKFKTTVKSFAVKSKKTSVATVKKVTVKKGKALKFKVTGSKKLTKKASSKITATVTLKKAVKGKKKYSLTFKATVKAAASAPAATPTEAPAVEETVNSFADLAATLAKVQATGGKVTLDTTEAGAFSISAADYSKVDLVVNAPNADIVNAATFKSVEIKAIKASTWTEAATGNAIAVTAATPVRVVVAAAAKVASLIFKGTATTVSKVEVAGSVDKIAVETKEPVDVVATGTATVAAVEVSAQGAAVTVEASDTAKITSVAASKGADVDVTASGQATITTVTAADAGTKVDVVANGSSTVSTVKVEGAAAASVDGTSNNTTTIDITAATKDANVTVNTDTVKVQTDADTDVKDVIDNKTGKDLPTEVVTTATATPAPSASTSPVPTTKPVTPSTGGGGSNTPTTVAVTDVSIDKTSPKVGDTITATATFENSSSVPAGTTYAWFTAESNIDVGAESGWTKIDGETTRNLVIKAEYLTKYIKVEVAYGDKTIKTMVDSAVDYSDADKADKSKLESSASALALTVGKDATEADLMAAIAVKANAISGLNSTNWRAAGIEDFTEGTEGAQNVKVTLVNDILSTSQITVAVTVSSSSSEDLKNSALATLATKLNALKSAVNGYTSGATTSVETALTEAKEAVAAAKAAGASNSEIEEDENYGAIAEAESLIKVAAVVAKIAALKSSSDIDGLSNASDVDTAEAAIAEAETDFGKLSDEEKNNVTEDSSVSSKLSAENVSNVAALFTALEGACEAKKAALEVADIVAAIDALNSNYGTINESNYSAAKAAYEAAKADFDALEDASAVTNSDALDTFAEALSDFVDDQINAVIEQIEALVSTVSGSEYDYTEVTTENYDDAKTAIAEARGAVDNLQTNYEVEDSKITNLNTLTGAEASLDTYETAASAAKSAAEDALSALSSASTAYDNADTDSKAEKAAELYSAYTAAVEKVGEYTEADYGNASGLTGNDSIASALTALVAYDQALFTAADSLSIEVAADADESAVISALATPIGTVSGTLFTWAVNNITGYNAGEAGSVTVTLKNTGITETVTATVTYTIAG